MAEKFDPAWLALREPADHRSRASAATTLLERAWREHGWSRVLDLGAGTGSNLRYLAPRLPVGQHWTLVDHDANLLARAAPPNAAIGVSCVDGDLADIGLRLIPETHADLVTGSALLDLVSKAWLADLVSACRAARCAAHFALTYDGTMQWHAAPGERRPDDDPDDGLVRRAVNAHQRRDKGLGPALGPMAGLTAETRFRAAGYRVWLLPSPWRLGPDDASLARALVDGWETAAVEEGRTASADVGAVTGAAELDRMRTWAARRRAMIAGGRFGLTVGHLDLLALPA